MAGTFYENDPTLHQGLNDRLSAEIGERSPPGIARIEKWFMAGKQTFKSIGILSMSAKNILTNQLRWNRRTLVLECCIAPPNAARSVTYSLA